MSTSVPMFIPTNIHHDLHHGFPHDCHDLHHDLHHDFPIITGECAMPRRGCAMRHVQTLRKGQRRRVQRLPGLGVEEPFEAF